MHGQRHSDGNGEPAIFERAFAMELKPSPLWLHAYSGKEHGLMIVGTPSAMKALGQQLLDASDVQRTQVPEAWPREIATPEIVGPYKDIRGFTLTFHIQGTAALEEIIPLQRRTLWPPLFFLVASCAASGVVTVWRWLLAMIL